MKRIVILAIMALIAGGCATQNQRVPSKAISHDGPTIYLTHVDRIPREVFITVPSGSSTNGVDNIASIGTVVDVLGGALTDISPALIDAYRDVERNTATRSVEILITGCTNLTTSEINDIVTTFQEITGQRFPTR